MLISLRAEQGLFRLCLSEPSGLGQAWQGQGHPRGSWLRLPVPSLSWPTCLLVRGCSREEGGPSQYLGPEKGRRRLVALSEVLQWLPVPSEEGYPLLPTSVCLRVEFWGPLSRSPFQKLTLSWITSPSCPLTHTRIASHPRRHICLWFTIKPSQLISDLWGRHRCP